MISVHGYISGKFLRFCFVGVATAIIYFGLLFLAKEVLGLPSILSVSIAYFSSVIFHFGTNKKFTFGYSGEKKISILVKYGIVLLINYVATIIIIFLAKMLNLNDYIGVCLSLPITMMMSYLFFSRWVFNEK